MALLEDIKSNFPWLVEIGLDSFVIDKIREGATIDETLASVRQTSQYRARFPGILREDGSRRFATEAEYLQEEDRYRQTLIDFGAYDPNQDTPQVFSHFMENGVQPDELGRRFQVYRALERGSQDIRDAFYVYSGIDISVDDLYEAVTSHTRRNELLSTYEDAVAGQELTYETFLNRVTEKGIERMTQTTRELARTGVLTEQGRQALLNTAPDMMRELAGALYTTSYNSESPTMTLDELLNSFEYAMIGSAATSSGFELPDAQRLQEFVNAGVDRARALRGYSQAALREAGLESMAERFNRGSISQQVLEDAFVLGEAKAASDVTRLFNQESALGKTGQGFARNVEGDRIVQQGRSRR